MKRLLLEGDCTMLERSLLTSIDLDVPPPLALERLRVNIGRTAENALVPAMVAAPEARAPRLTQQRAAIGAVLGLAAGFALFLMARHDHEGSVSKDPSVVLPERHPHVPIAAAEAESVLPPASATPAMQVSASVSAPVMNRPPPITSAPRRVVPLPSSAISPSSPSSIGAPFDKGAAARALGGVDLSDCRNMPGPDGAGHVTVTFQADGTVFSAVVDQGPFLGTPRGGCVAGKFRSATVPPFEGSLVRVGKSFTL